MAAYGLYTHIASNKFRSVLLLAGLFLLIYVLVYAGALIAERAISSIFFADFLPWSLAHHLPIYRIESHGLPRWQQAASRRRDGSWSWP